MDRQIGGQIDRSHLKKRGKTMFLSQRVTIHQYLFGRRPVAGLWKGEEKAIEHPEKKKLSLPRSSMYQPGDKATLISTRGHNVPWPQPHENNNLQSSIKRFLYLPCSAGFLLSSQDLAVFYRRVCACECVRCMLRLGAKIYLILWWHFIVIREQ